MNSVDQAGLVRLELALQPFSDFYVTLIIFFIGPPLFQRPIESVELVKGSDIVLEGVISGSPPFQISFLLNGKLIRDQKDHKISVESDKVTLQISNCESKDAGMYQCIAANDVGETSCSFQLSLKG